MANNDVPKCKYCDGWGFEPYVIPMRACGACEGSGRPRARQAELGGAR